MISLIPGYEGAAEAAGRGAMAIVVDALRSSATIAAMLTAGASAIFACADPDAARRVASAIGGSPLLAGEWKSRTPDGFDLGNSPLQAAAADLRGRRIVFTSSNGAPLLMACRGASRIALGGPTNALKIADAARGHLDRGGEVIIIPAGDLGRECVEDWAGAVVLADTIGREIDCRWEWLPAYWRERIAERGLEPLMRAGEHGRRLEALGFGADIGAAATADRYQALPEVSEFTTVGGATAAILTAPLDYRRVGGKIAALDGNET